MYNAFISYSHGADNIFAPALQSALQKFAKPWYKKRNLSIFRDESNLSASPLLWNNITKALDESEYFILLASSASEKSKWVNKEVEYWMQHKSIDKILVALTEGNVDWDNEHNCFLYPEQNALPPALDHAFDSEPFYIDMRQVKTQKDLSADNPIFKKEILKLAAVLHGLEPNDMASEEVSAHRRVIRIRNTAFFLLIGLFAAALIGGFAANTQKHKATDLAGKNVKLAKAFQSVYFYADHFALSHDIKGFYFTDKNGDKIEQLGEWQDASQFNYTGFARVKRIGLSFLSNEGDDDFPTYLTDYIIDTLGRSYRSAYHPEDIDSNTTALDLSDQHLNILPRSISDHPKLEVLLLPNNKLTELPETIGKLHNLSHLDLSKNKLKRLPRGIGTLQNLEILDLRTNKLTGLPAEIGNLTTLKELHLLFSIKNWSFDISDISTQYLTQIPKEIGQLKHLTWLDMGLSDSAVLPPEIKDCDSLKYLMLWGDSMAHIPKEIWKLKALKIFSLQNIEVDAVPHEIDQMQNLAALAITNSNLRALPDELFKMPNLISLSLASNQLEIVPEQIGMLNSLVMIDFSGNKLRRLPRTIGNLKHAYYLSFGDNQLTEIPEEISALKNLNGLSLQNNKITSLPEFIGRLDSLDWLNLNGNQLQSLPEEIGDLRRLTTLNLKENQLTTVPSEIGNLVNLKSLDLSDNKLTTLPSTMDKLTKLTELNLSGNQIDEGEFMRIEDQLHNCKIVR